MITKMVGWFGLISVMLIGLFGLKLYSTFLTFLTSFMCGVITILYFNYNGRKIFVNDLDQLDDPLQITSFSVQLPKVLDMFENEKPNAKFDNRITGSETVDSFLNEILSIIINDYVNVWYEVLTPDQELTTYTIRKIVLAAGVNLANRIKSVDWVHLLSTKFPEELTTHLKLYKQSRVRLKHMNLTSGKGVINANSRVSPKKYEENKQTHRRNKSDTDLGWSTDHNLYSKSKSYGSTENISGKTLKDLFFDLESTMESNQLCRDKFCLESEKEYALLCEVSETILYLVIPDEAWRCQSMKLILIELLSSVVLRPLFDLLTDPDNINRVIIKTCCRDSNLPSDIFLMVIRCSEDPEELDAILELVQKEIQKLHSKDSVGECELPIRQQLSSLHYLTRIINTRRATLGPQEGASDDSNTVKMSASVKRSLEFINASNAWRSNAQYLLEIEINESNSLETSKIVIDNLRSSALELCDIYLAPNKQTIFGLPDNCYTDLVRKITTEDDEFTNNPISCFDDVQKCIFDALEDVQIWQTDYLDTEDLTERSSGTKQDDKFGGRKYTVKCKRLMKSCIDHLPKLFNKSKYNIRIQNKSFTFPRSKSPCIPSDKNHTFPKCKICNIRDVLTLPNLSARHNRSHSDIVGNPMQKIAYEVSGQSNLSSAANLSFSHSEIGRTAKPVTPYFSASIIETALVQDKGKTFGIYAIAVTRLADNEVWHIYRRYSDFYDLHTSIKDKWPELSRLEFPAKKTFQNTSRVVLERRKKVLNRYLQSLLAFTREARYAALLSEDYLGGFLSPENQAERHSSSIDALLVNSLRAGMRTLKNMPDQFATTVDGVMDGISKVFQGKNENYPEDLKTNWSSDAHLEGDESVALRLLEEVLGISGLWLRRRLLAPLRTVIADRVNRKVLEFVSSLTSPRNVVHYLKYVKQWLSYRDNLNIVSRDSGTKARTRVAAKVALLASCSDDLRHIVGSDTARRGLLTVFDLFQSQEINRRLLFVLLEATLSNLFPDNNIPNLFRKMYSNSTRVAVVKKTMKK